MKQEQVDYYKDLKSKMSTKMVGETLEQHCSIEFEQYIRPMMPHAYFEKDNDVTDGTKGDFIFRDSEDGTEYISIMFEMKNEMETTATKHKNDDFLKKLDEDRRKRSASSPFWYPCSRPTTNSITAASSISHTSIRRCTSYGRSSSCRLSICWYRRRRRVSNIRSNSSWLRIRRWT